MDDDCTQRMTQTEFVPRRYGHRNNSGLSDVDVSDVICILHPSTPAAYNIVNYTAAVNNQHVLQNNAFNNIDYGTDFLPTEAETLLLSSRTEQPTDLALRFSSRVINQAAGFCFGRNPEVCDINLDYGNNTNKRVSMTHFCIYYNSSGILMLEDHSTNGTIVDGISVGGKRKNEFGKLVPKNPPATRMLSSGSIIEILSEKQNDVIKFLVTIPMREGHVEQFKEHFRRYIAHQPAAQDRAVAAYQDAAMPDGAARGVLAAPFAGPPNTKSIPGLHPNLSSDHGMRWSGGDVYKCTGVLGKGAFATVYQLATRREGELFAAKELEKRRFMKDGRLDSRLDNEMRIMMEIKHPNVVEFVDYEETDEHLYIIMEYVPGGDMAGYMQSHGALAEPLAKTMTQQILEALAYLHEKNITHRDIKPDNILIHSEDPLVVKLTDFGLSKVVKNNETFLKTFCGTLLYCAPEVFPHYDTYMVGKRPKRRRGAKNTHRTYGSSVDIWSYAAVLWFVLCGEPPFEGIVDGNGKGMFNKIMETPLDVTPLQECEISEQCIDLLLQMLDTDPLNRPDEIACLQHAWFDEVPSTAYAPSQGGLEDIVEEDELDASQLSLNDRTQMVDESQESTDSFGDVRQPKRQKGESFMLHRQQKMSISDDSFGSVPIMNDIRESGLQAQSRPLVAQSRLFGEVSESALQSSGLLGQVGNFHDEVHRTQSYPPPRHARNNDEDDGYQQQAGIQEYNDQAVTHHNEASQAVQELPFRPPQLPANSSWRESMVQELNMESPESSAGLPAAAPDHNLTPTLDQPQHPDSGDHDATPKAKSVPFRRQVKAAIPASFFYDPLNPATHNVEYASKVSGLKFTADGNPLPLDSPHPSLPGTAQTSVASSEEHGHTAWATTNIGSNVGTLPANVTQDLAQPSNHSAAQYGPTPIVRKSSRLQQQQQAGLLKDSGTKMVLKPRAIDDQLQLPPLPLFAKPQPIIGRLTSTQDSFVAISFQITKRVTTWGRHPGNDVVYRDANDTRIPKIGLEVWFVAPGIQNGEEQVNENWTMMKNIDTVVATRGRSGIYVNGVQLKEKDDQGRKCFGRVYSGDEVCVSQGKKGQPGLTFICEFLVGSAKKTRKSGEKFKVEYSTSG